MFRNITLVLSRPKFSFRHLRKMSTDADDVLFKEIKDKGVIILNRPKALNSLNLSMVKKLHPVLTDWESKKTLVLVKGAGDKAFCAGGDVKAVISVGMKGDKQLGYDFFKHEYATNGLIGRYKIPYIAFIDGIVMGGGVGLSVHGRYRVATERTLFAMPETQIGLFPDVGGSYFLPKLPGRLGAFLALTGQRLKGSDVLKVGVATHICDSKQLPELEEQLMNCSNESDVDAVLNKFNKKDIPEFSLQSVLDKINHCFEPDSVEEIFSRLEKDGSPWSEETLKVLNKMSPTSLKVTLRQLELGKNMSLNDCLIMEYRLAANCLDHKDFYEGVRALLIDKDQNPKWDPASVKDVSEDLVKEHFREVAEEQHLKAKL
ncbi:unnamed protein product [Callosobruchus maculatus]|uniref:3-hydroxyisobutyryl-CoA hydrolase, mitochondrial n=1 Tax=Callosobruchus maculatus TaxID=64391 RepID=A0A653DK08_CALMS|nr:unnamed protein product [Callosobruchus maculatus]